MPSLEFCRECERKVWDDRTDICPECRKRLREYEKKYHCIVDIGVRGQPGTKGGTLHGSHVEKRKE